VRLLGTVLRKELSLHFFRSLEVDTRVLRIDCECPRHLWCPCESPKAWLLELPCEGASEGALESALDGASEEGLEAALDGTSEGAFGQLRNSFANV
jgi:hypothetical protein